MVVFSYIRNFGLAALMAGVCWGQAGLSVSSGSAAPGGTVTLNLSFAGNGSQAASAQWQLAYPGANVSAVSVAAASALTGAGKNVSCSAGSGVYTCIASGGANTIPDGVIATARFTMSSAATTTNVSVNSARAASTTGSAVSVSASEGAISVSSPATSTACIPAMRKLVAGA
jgi:hypothetical protein